MYGLQLAFKEYSPRYGISGSAWNNFENFIYTLGSEGFWEMAGNTLRIGMLKIVFAFPSSIILALMLNEVVCKRFKKTVQTIANLPYFISWVIVSSIVFMFLTKDGGVLNKIITALGGKPVFWYAQSKWWPGIITISGIWKNVGWGTIVFLSAITNINPDLYEAAIGDENTPITAMIRHYSRLMVFKTNSAWSMDYNVVTTAIGTITTAFYVTPVNRQFGNEAPGQVHLLENNPLTLDSDAVYQWKATTSSGNITSDNRNASRVSDRVKSTFSEFELSKVKTFNRRYENEYWFLYGGKACILNYGNDTWYLYTNMPFMQMLEIEGQVYGFREDGGVVHVSRQYRNDDGQEIDAYAETGNMDFDKDWLLKYSPMIFVAIKPESNARVTVTVETNRRSDYPEKTVSAGIATFKNVDFAHFSFGTNRKPQVRRLKMKVKKATFYKLIFKSFSASATATVLEADVNLRYAGKVK
jgi:hypothetical protein